MEKYYKISIETNGETFTAFADSSGFDLELAKEADNEGNLMPYPATNHPEEIRFLFSSFRTAVCMQFSDPSAKIDVEESLDIPSEKGKEIGLYGASIILIC